MPISIFQPEDIEKALLFLEQGGVLAHATETCYGFACDLRNKEALSSLFRLKERPHHKPVSALFRSIEHAKEYTEWNDRADDLARMHLPGPLTIIVPLKQDAPYALYPTPEGSNTIGVRISSHPFAQRLSELYEAPLSTTSANVHMGANPYSLDDILGQFEATNEKLAVMDGGNIPITSPSTVVDLSDHAGLVPLRQGNIAVR